MLKQIDHIGIAVENLDQIIETYRTAFGVEPDFKEIISDQKVEIAGYRTGESVIEYFSPLTGNTSIGRFLEKRGNAIHHIAYRVDNLEDKLKKLMEAGFTLIDKEPRAGADGKKIAFLHPKDFNGILIELCEL